MPQLLARAPSMSWDKPRRRAVTAPALRVAVLMRTQCRSPHPVPDISLGAWGAATAPRTLSFQTPRVGLLCKEGASVTRPA